jgi:RHS repeat-associated protein
VTATFAYDARNRCVARTINGVTTYLAYDGWSLLEERNANGGLLAEYIHGATIDEILQRTTGSGAVYYHHDGLGNTIAVTDNTGALAESYTYDVFGTPSFFDANGVGLPSSVVGNRFLFTGREFLAETGLYDYRNRFYSPVLGRFLQTDPIRFEAKDVNLYRYVWNKPAEWLDPSGLFVSANPRDAQTVEQSVGVEAAKAMGAINDFSDTYADMRKANWKLSDKYFHCLANCKAAKRGETGRRVAEAISEIRELSDEYLKGDSRSECDTDREANDHGREAGRKGQNCKTACNKYRPRGLPSQY